MVALGIVIGLFGIAMLAGSGSRRTARDGTVACAVVLGGLAFIYIRDINNRVAAPPELAIASLGVGLLVVAFAAVLALIGAFLPASRAVETIGGVSPQGSRAKPISRPRLIVGVPLILFVLVGFVLNLVSR